MRGSIQRSGKKTWRIRFDLGVDTKTGKRRVQSIVVLGGKREAQKKMNELLAAKGNGSFIAPTKITVGDFVQERIDHWLKAGEIGEQTADRYGNLNRNQIAPHIGSFRVQALSTIDVEKWHATLRTSGSAKGKPLAPLTVRHAHRLLAKSLREAVKHGLLSRSVAGRDGQRAPRVARQEVEIIPKERVSEVVTKLRGRALYPKIVVLLFTGVRRGEVLGMRWCDVDLVKKVLRVRQSVEELKTGLRIKSSAKTDAGRRDISLPNIVVDALTAHRRAQLELRMKVGLGREPADALVFPALDGMPSRPCNLSGDWREATRKLELPDVTLHALRHTHASMLIDAKWDVVKVSKRLGHASPAITLQTYAHQFAARDIVSAEAMNDVVAQLLPS